MDKIFELTVLFAYRRALALGADDSNAIKAALSVIFDAKPDLEETEAHIMLSIILGAPRPRCGRFAEQRPVGESAAHAA